METKKYIIEIPDNTAWIQWVKVSDKDGHVCFDFKDPEDLIPYTEPDLEQAQKKAYYDGYETAKHDYEGCLKQAHTDAIRMKGYQKGLSDAWDAARKIACDRPHGGFRIDTKQHIFGASDYAYILANYNASEAIEKIRQYEQEEQIQVGDEVIGIYSSGEQTNPFVITKGNSDYYFGIYSGSGEFCQGGLKLQKTGRHFPEIAKVLKKMQEKES